MDHLVTGHCLNWLLLPPHNDEPVSDDVIQ